MKLSFPPRGIRLKDAPAYLGIDKGDFEANVRPYLHERKRGRKVIFDRLELDALFEEDMKRRGRLGRTQWDDQSSPKGSSTARGRTGRTTKTSTSTSNTGTGVFEAARARLNRKKQKGG